MNFPIGTHWERAALDDLKRLPRRTWERILNAVIRFAETGHGNLIALQGEKDEYRLRVGEWRILFHWETKTDTIHIRRVRPRGSAYQ